MSVLKKFKKKNALIVLISGLLLMNSGCASDMAARKKADLPEEPKTKAISSINTSKETDGFIVTISGDQLLTYTSVKQPFPLGVILYFPDTRLDNVGREIQPESSVVSSVNATELTEKGHTSRIEIKLKNDVAYEVSRKGNGLIVKFPESAEPVIEEQTIESAEKTEPAAAVEKQELPAAENLKSITASSVENGAKVTITADGTIKDYKQMTLENPARIVFDIPNLKSEYKNVQVLPVDTEWIRQVRHCSYPDRMRVVLDTDSKFLSSYRAVPTDDGMIVTVGEAIEEEPEPARLPAVTAKTEEAKAPEQSGKPAILNRIDFVSEESGTSTVLLGTTEPVHYDIVTEGDNRLRLELYNTRIPEFRQRPLITTRFESAVNRISPVEIKGITDKSIVLFELRELVAYRVEQSDGLIQVHFEASSMPAKSIDDSQLPPWKEVLTKSAETIVAPSAAEASAAAGEAGEKPLFTGEPIALDFYQTDIKNVFRIIQSVSGKNFAIDDEVSGKVTLTFDEPVPWDQVLDLILKMNSLGKAVEGDIIRISTLDRLKKEEALRREVLQAKLQNTKEEKSLEPIYTEYLSVNYSNAKSEILPHIEKIITKDRGSISVDERNNQIIITDVRDIIKQAREIVKNIDKVTPQVLIEARVVEANTTFTREIGTAWSVSGNTSDSASNDLGGTIGYDTSMNLGTGSVGSFGLTFNQISSSNFNLSARLMAMESNGDGKIISSPRVITLDNKEAKIEQGVEYPYLKEIDDDGDAKYELKEITLTLTVTPHVTPDNRIAMNINIKKDDLGPEISNQRSFLKKEVQTELLVEDGNTIVIGGIIKTRKEDTITGFPLLKEIPFLGWMFKSKEKTDDREELLLFITPQIVQLEQRVI